MKELMNILVYITYDGILDPLGQSQIAPCVKNAAKTFDIVYVLSWEKPLNLAGLLETSCFPDKVVWIKRKFNKGPSRKVGDLISMIWTLFFTVLKLGGRKKIVIHCRGHVGAAATWLACMVLQRMRNILVLFDYRGDWISERVDKGGWSYDSLLDRLSINVWRWLEFKVLHWADHINTLTARSAERISDIYSVDREKISVIPCAVDNSLFKVDPDARMRLKSFFPDLSPDTVVLGYLGSIGPMYRFYSFVNLAKILVSQNPRKKFIFFVMTNNPDNVQTENLVELDFAVGRFSRKEVADLLPAVDWLVSFPVASGARFSMSPVRVGEALASGVKVITSPGVGDLDSFLKEQQVGFTLDPENLTEMNTLGDDLVALTMKEKVRVSSVARKFLSLNVANQKYNEIFNKMLMR